MEEPTKKSLTTQEVSGEQATPSSHCPTVSALTSDCPTPLVRSSPLSLVKMGFWGLEQFSLVGGVFGVFFVCDFVFGVLFFLFAFLGCFGKFWGVFLVSLPNGFLTVLKTTTVHKLTLKPFQSFS